MATEISDWNDLDNVRNDLTGDYVLVNDLDSDAGGYAGIGDDFEPIGFIEDDDFTSEFGGSFDGDGFEIADLVIEYDGVDGDIGFFASTDTGALIENLSVDGAVTVTNSDSFNYGGLVGNHTAGTIQNCVSHVDVTASDGTRVGGLAGFNDDTVTDSYATGSVEGDDRVGGLVGQNADTVTESYATGSVEGGEQVGGLVGNNNETVTESYATGSVEGNDDVGGLVGQSGSGSLIDKTYSLGNVTGSDEVGGLYGKGFTVDVSESYAVGNVTGDTNVGGFAGDSGDGNRERNYFNTESTTQSDAFGTSDGGEGVTGLTTDEMQGSEAETNMDGFDFENVWSLVIENENSDGDGYPILRAIDFETQGDEQNLTITGFFQFFDLSVETNPATDISAFAATLNGELVELDDEAEDADVFFEFGETVDQNQTPTQTLTEPATFDELIDELEPNTTFEFRAVAEAQDEENETFTDEGDILTFDTDIVTLDGTITLDETAAENADVIVHNLTQDTFEGRLSTDTDGEYSVDLPDANREDTVAVAVDFADGLERYGRLITTVIE